MLWQTFTLLHLIRSEKLINQFTNFPLLPIQEINHSEYVRPDMAVYMDYIEGCLTFKNPTHHNNGNYTLEATNYLGVVNATVYGHFLDRPFDGKFGFPN